MRHPTSLLVLLSLLSPAPAAPAATGPGGGLPDPLHLTLQRSAPEAGSTLTSPREIRLWFSQRPQRGSTSLSLTGPGGSVPLGPIQEDPEDDRSFAAAIPSPPGPGSYRVSWRTMAQDGHVIRGEFTFAVTEVRERGADKDFDSLTGR
jgi:copper resistance protein C